jgi:hypothetical protein
MLNSNISVDEKDHVFIVEALLNRGAIVDEKYEDTDE